MLIVLVVAVLGRPVPAVAAPGDLDLTFSGDGRQTTDFDNGGVGDAQAVARQPDGKLIVAGRGTADFTVARYNADGSLDASFSGDGRQTARPGLGDQSIALALQPDGKIVVAGSAAGAFDTDFGVVRFNAVGSLDTSFSGDGKQTTDFGQDEEAAAIAIQPDGKLVLAGRSVDGGDGRVTVAVARYASDGSLDHSFSGDGRHTTDFGPIRPSASASAVAVQADGRIVLAGSTRTSMDVPWEFGVARLQPDGSADASFSGDGKQTTAFGGNADGRDMALQPDGRIVVAGWVQLPPPSPSEPSGSDFAVARYNADGSLDASFAGDGRQTTDFPDRGFDDERAHAVAIQPDGKIEAFGEFDRDPAIVRYHADGSLDASLSGDGIAIPDPGFLAAAAFDGLVQPDGKLVLAGVLGGFVIVARLDAGGLPDPSFADGGFAITEVGGFDVADDVAVQGDGKLVVAGTAGDDFAVARYQANGSIDSGFSGDGLWTLDLGGFEFGRAVAVQGDGKLVVAGRSGAYFVLVRLLADGSEDPSFGDAGVALASAGGEPAAVAVQGDGKIVAAGGVGVARFNPDGSLDDSFAGDGVQNISFGTLADDLTALALQPDGKILVGGNADVDLAVARLNPDGTLDGSFSGDGMQTVDFGSRDSAVALLPQNDGKAIMVGNTGIGGVGIARLTQQGVLDAGFSGDGRHTTGLQLVSSDAALQADGEIVVAGATVARGWWDFALARFNPDGSPDLGFSGDGWRATSITGPDYSLPLPLYENAIALALQEDGKIVQAGWDARADFALARFQVTGPPDTSPPETSILSGPTGPTSDATPRFTFSASEDSPTFECRIDGGSFTHCSPPYWPAKPAPGFPDQLSAGAHSFEVRAGDHSGNVDPSPARHDFVIEGSPPPPPPPPLDWDADGVPNDRDDCPMQPGPPPTGCPGSAGDRDGDGVPDGLDGCPDQPAAPPTGCPVVSQAPADRDGDGMPDAIDGCPGVRGPPPTGCPDGIPDAAAIRRDLAADLSAAARALARLNPGRAARGRFLKLTLSPITPGRVSVGVAAHPSRGTSSVVARATAVVAKAGPIVLKARLTRRGKRLLARAARSRARMTLRATFRTASGAQSTATRSFRFRAKRR